mmetsp:Transcript_53926/g.114576  ORF Transcript_53926/g.114576 Transcript_53926/m.114576 type:complete len:208 (+) Transcript_53926:307-930(+)
MQRDSGTMKMRRAMRRRRRRAATAPARNPPEMPASRWRQGRRLNINGPRGTLQRGRAIIVTIRIERAIGKARTEAKNTIREARTTREEEGGYYYYATRAPRRGSCSSPAAETRNPHHPPRERKTVAWTRRNRVWHPADPTASPPRAGSAATRTSTAAPPGGIPGTPSPALTSHSAADTSRRAGWRSTSRSASDYRRTRRRLGGGGIP